MTLKPNGGRPCRRYHERSIPFPDGFNVERKLPFTEHSDETPVKDLLFDNGFPWVHSRVQEATKRLNVLVAATCGECSRARG